ncbi:MAG TPA: thioredoxin-like domain-containing protein [Isosphaeraceae bacterium]|jgi:thiol-disulfide isomerase/thioredoxin
MLHRKSVSSQVFGYATVAASLASLVAGLVLWRGAPADPLVLPRPDVAVLPVSYQGIPGGLEGGIAWINTAGPIHLEALRGKVVLLDFWTYCCINCHHVLPDLAALEQKYKNQLVVIGVHSPKFEAERLTANIRKKVAEYRIKHPVINDANQVLWNRFGVNSWPTLVLIDPTGQYVGSVSGEGQGAILDQAIGDLVKKYRDLGQLNEATLTFFPENEKPHDGPLLYPGKVTADAAGRRLFISDTGHNRIVITDLQGQAQAVVGDGGTGLTDGPFETATFNRPQGTCLVGDVLYVADTENHAIRAVDLAARTVRTVAGTGQQSSRRSGSGPARTTGLNSPWDVLRIPETDVLAIAMAGPHQIWTLDLEKQTVGVWAGSGVENIVDGDLDSAAFAQPSGLATDGRQLFVADSEVSGIRTVAFSRAAGNRQVGRLVGMGLFAFGDVDGQGARVRLQHCLGLAYADGKLYVADTYNNKIKVCDPKTRTVRTFLGTKAAGDSDAIPTFDEPGGLSVAGTTLYVADTNNHKIRAVDLKSRATRTLTLAGVAMPTPPTPPTRAPGFPNAAVVDVPEAKLAPGSSVTLDVTLVPPVGFKVNPQAPLVYLVQAPDRADALGSDVSPTGSRIDPPAARFSVPVPLAREASTGESLRLRLSVSAMICREGSEGLCRVQNYVWNIPLAFADGGAPRVAVRTPAPATASR